MRVTDLPTDKEMEDQDKEKEDKDEKEEDKDEKKEDEDKKRRTVMMVMRALKKKTRFGGAAVIRNEWI